jgi:23S rRNA (pseudouridine1915-N3)-methyltransferase
MRLILAGIGRMKPGPERDLFERYKERTRALCRTAGLTGLDLVEIDESRARSSALRKSEEAAALVKRMPNGAELVLLDEGGRSLTSSDFARFLATARDRGVSALAVAVGGPDGFDPTFAQSAALLFAFGAATLPHQIVRVLAAEQIYRALTILTGHPYHRA